MPSCSLSAQVDSTVAAVRLGYVRSDNVRVIRLGVPGDFPQAVKTAIDRAVGQWNDKTSTLVCGVFAVTAVPSVGRAARRQQDSQAVRNAKGKAFEVGGLRAAARVTGTYRQTMSPHGGRDAPTLEFLTDNSRVIVIGQIRNGRGWLNETGDTISTDYDLAVERVLKGEVKPGDHVTVSVLGGRVGFPEGTWAQIDTPGMVPPLVGQTFLMFLEISDRHPSGEERAAAHGLVYSPAFMSRGMYLIDGGIVNPRVYPQHPLAVAYRGKAEAVIVNAILDIVDKSPGASDGRGALQNR